MNINYKINFMVLIRFLIMKISTYYCYVYLPIGSKILKISMCS